MGSIWIFPFPDFPRAPFFFSSHSLPRSQRSSVLLSLPSFPPPLVLVLLVLPVSVYHCCGGDAPNKGKSSRKLVTTTEHRGKTATGQKPQPISQPTQPTNRLLQ
jgi:hypothetical protein